MHISTSKYIINPIAINIIHVQNLSALKMMFVFKYLLVIACVASGFAYQCRVYCPNGTVGLDLSTAATVNQFRNLKKDYHFAIIRAYRSIGAVDPNVVTNIANARAAGFWDVEVYMFPCPRCSRRPLAPLAAADQMAAMLNALRNSRYGWIWLDIEDDNDSTYWFRDQAANRRFFEELMTAAMNQTDKTIGVYTNKQNWEKIMGNTYTEGSTKPLWYAHYDDKASFDDFFDPGGRYGPIGGWTRPYMKQFKDNITKYGVTIDENWRE